MISQGGCIGQALANVNFLSRFHFNRKQILIELAVQIELNILKYIGVTHIVRLFFLLDIVVLNVLSK